MKTWISVLLLICVLCSAVGCGIVGIPALSEPKELVFPIELYHLQLTADTTFYQTDGGSFDLQITNDKAYISVMAYKYMDISEDLTPLDVYEMQNEDLFGKREAVSVVEEKKTQTLSSGEMTRAIYSAERDGIKNYYATYLIDFPNDEVFAWVLVTAMPSYLSENTDALHAIVCSLAPTE